jgi:hypothetical protein
MAHQLEMQMAIQTGEHHSDKTKNQGRKTKTTQMGQAFYGSLSAYWNVVQLHKTQPTSWLNCCKKQSHFGNWLQWGTCWCKKLCRKGRVYA